MDTTALRLAYEGLLGAGDTLVLDQPVPLAALIGGLADNHVPEHTGQLLALRVNVPA